MPDGEVVKSAASLFQWVSLKVSLPTEIEVLRNPWCVQKRVPCGATNDIAFARRNPLLRYDAADFSLDVRESHSSIFPAR